MTDKQKSPPMLDWAVMPNGIKRFILWDYARATWQYDVMVGVILAFVFLTPREWFRDQPRVSNVALLPSGHGGRTFWIEPELLSDTPENQRLAKLDAILTQRTGRRQTVTRVEPIFDSEREIKGYMAFVTP